MALTTRGKAVVGVTAVLVLLGAAALGIFLFTGGENPLDIIPGRSRPETCPLTGVEGNVPGRPALAVKIENLSVARPQAGLDAADIVYEQPVEGGITRFVVLFHCRNAERIGPVRSVREVDPSLLVQFGSPLFGYAGGVASVRNAVTQAGIVDVNYLIAVDAYQRDPNRDAPHNLYSSTRALYRAGRGGTEPESIFMFDEDPPEGGERARRVHAQFSSQSDVIWRYRRQEGEWLRFHGTDPHVLEDGDQVSAKNVIVQVVKLRLTGRLDPAGNPVPEPEVVGRGRAFVFRDGRVIEGRWIRQSEDDVTQFVDSQGNEIALAPGVTWIELFPRDRFDDGLLDF